jgi:hypothetical protein
MGMVNRRGRQRRTASGTLEGLWERLQPPPDWAHEPGEHHEELCDLVFFGSDTGPWKAPQKHPHYADWWKAYIASKH